MCIHMKLHSDSHGVKRPIGRLASPHSLSQPTHHHVSSFFISFFFFHFASSILLRAQNMTWLLGLHLTCFSLPAPDIWPTPFKGHFRHSTDENEPIDHMLMESQLPILGTGIFFFLVEFTIFSTVFILSPPPPFF